MFVFSLGRGFDVQAARRLAGKGQDSATAAEARLGQQAAHQAADERVHGVGEGRAPEDPEGVPGHAQLEHLEDLGRALEGYVQLREAAVLRGAVPAVETAHGETPGLSVQAETEAYMHRGRQEDAHFGVQDVDAAKASGDETVVVQRWQFRDEFHIRSRSDDAHDLFREAVVVAAA